MAPVTVLCLAALAAASGALRTDDSGVLLQVDLAVDRSALDMAGDAPRKKPKSSNATSGAAAAKKNTTKPKANVSIDAAKANATASLASANVTDNATETSWCGFKSQPGFITAYTLPPTDNLLLDLTEAFKNGQNSLSFVVTAMSVSGTYADGKGYLTEFASPMEETANTMFELRLGRDQMSVDVYRPQLGLRTSDSETLSALRRGAGSGHFDTLGTFKCAQRGPASFNSKAGGMSGGLVNMMRDQDHDNSTSKDNATTSSNATGNATAGANLTDTIATEKVIVPEGTPFMAEGLLHKAVEEKEKRIIVSGGNLIRKGFFVADIVKQHTSYRLISAKAYKENLDVAVEYMMPDGLPLSVGYSLVQLPKKPMKPRGADDRLLYFSTDYKDLGVHDRYTDELPEESVDRKVSTIWRYNLAGLPNNQIRIHIDPTIPKRWRKWFREGVEAWNEAFKLIGQPTAVRAVCPDDEDWPKDYDISDARFSTISWTISSQVVSMGIAKVDPRSGEILKSDIVMSDGWVRSWLGDLDLLAPNFTHQLHQDKGYRFEACSDGNVILDRHRVPGRLRVGGDWGKKISLLSAAVGKPLTTSKRDDILGQGLKHVVTHETGHILGLRHNFKGSLGVTYNCIRSASCTAVHGLTASVMDYVPVNYPSADSPDVHLFSPVLGSYDKLAIRYGYTEEPPPPSKGDMNKEPMSSASLESQLKQVLLEAENFATCYDSDRISKQDPACAAYDMSADPLAYYEDEMRRLADVQRNLLNTSVMPGAPYTHYGEAVDQVLLMAESTGIKVTDWLGGMSNHYVYRRADGTHAPKMARRAVPADVQRRALALTLNIMRPGKAGLMPPKESLPYLVAATDGSGSVESLDLSRRERAIGKMMVTRVLQPEVLKKLYAEEQTRGGAGGLSSEEFLDIVIQEVLREGLQTSTTSEWDLHRALVSGLTAAHESGLPSGAIAHVAKHLKRLQTEVGTALVQVRNSLTSSKEDLEDQEVLRAHLTSLHQDIKKTLCQGQDASCDFVLPSAAVRATGVAPALAAVLALGSALLA